MTTQEHETIPLVPDTKGLTEWMFRAWKDPREVSFRKALREQPENLAWLEHRVRQFGLAPDGLPEVADPVHEATEITVRLLVNGPSEDDARAFIERNFEGFGLMKDYVIEDAHRVVVLNGPYYRRGDHFDNPLPQPPREDSDA